MGRGCDRGMLGLDIVYHLTSRSTSAHYGPDDTFALRCWKAHSGTAHPPGCHPHAVLHSPESTFHQVEEARAEALSRLPPGAAEFLRGRGRRKPAAGSTPTAASTAGGRPPAAAAAAPDAASTDQQRSAAADTQRRLHSAGEMPQRAPPRSGGGGGDGHSVPAAASAAARLRFSVEGQPLCFAPQLASAAPPAAGVLQRDPLRCGGGKAVSSLHIEAAVM